MKVEQGIRIVFYTRQPFTAIGLTSVLRQSSEFRLAACCESLSATLKRLRSERPEILLVQLPAPLNLLDLSHIHAMAAECRVVLWGEGPGGDFAFQAMHLGVRAIVPSCTPIDGLLTSLRSVHSGVLCFEKAFIDNLMLRRRVSLTKREGQIVSLVAQGCKNKEIGGRLGITEGTVKVYLYKLFKKLGVNDRLEMALYSREHLGAMDPIPDLREMRSRAVEVYVPESLPQQVRGAVETQRVN
jgi:two-component system nitrate/nitrite response regulator NarL